MTKKKKEAVKVKTLFVSDLHLGFRASQAEEFLKFLNTVEPEKIYLVGDIIDVWLMKSNFYWPQSHNDVIQKLLRNGTSTIYIPGNHDEFLRAYCDSHFGNISIMDSCVHEGIDGVKYLVIHGDQFDLIMQRAKVFSHIGSHAYDLSITINHWFNKIRKFFGLPYWSFSNFLKRNVKGAVNYLGRFEKHMIRYAKKQGCTGVICGHVHNPVIKEVEGCSFINCGDFVESLTAVVEHYNGKFELLYWEH